MKRIEQFDPKLRCIITLTRDLALAQAKKADQEIAAGKYRGPLHGIPWGGKDLLDTAGIPTTYGAEPYRNRIPAHDAAVVKRLHDAGAVLIAKLSLGALALNDIWFGGQTMNPWLWKKERQAQAPGREQPQRQVWSRSPSEVKLAAASSPHPCAAGLMGCVQLMAALPRTGAMTLCWSLDKLGPMTRSVEDTALILKTISGRTQAIWQACPANWISIRMPASAGCASATFPQWMKEAPATDVDRAALETVKKVGMEAVEVSIPDWPYDSMFLILFAEAAAAFEELTLSGGLIN